MNGTTGRALGVDLGSKRIGLALSDPTGTIASPLQVLTRSRQPDLDRKRIVDIARAEEATCIVVGLPLSLSGQQGPAARAATTEIEALRRLAEPAGIRVVAHDERLTTVSAHRSLGEAGMRARDRRDVVDKVAAAVLLQAWLERSA